MPAAALMAVTGGAQVGEGERERAGELQWKAGIPFPGSVGAGREWKGELRGCSREKRPWRTAAACLGKGRARLWARACRVRARPRLLGASMVKEEGMGAGREARQPRQRGQRPRRSVGRGCRRAARQQRGVVRAAQRGQACALEWGGDGAQ